MTDFIAIFTLFGGQDLQYLHSACTYTLELMIKWMYGGCWGFPGSSAGKESACNAGDPGLIFGSGRCPGEGIGYPLWYSWASLMAQMVKNPPAMWETWVWSLSGKIPWRRTWWPTPVFLPGESHGQRSLAGYSPWCFKELDMTEWLRRRRTLIPVPTPGSGA